MRKNIKNSKNNATTFQSNDFYLKQTSTLIKWLIVNIYYQTSGIIRTTAEDTDKRFKKIKKWL